MTTITIPAPAVIVKINGTTYGAVSSFTWGSNTPHKSVNGIDDLSAQELIPTNAVVSGQIGLYRITGSGGLQGIGVTGTFAEVASLKYFTIQLIDIRTDLIMFEARECVCESESWNVAVKSLVTGTMAFKGLRWINESAT